MFQHKASSHAHAAQARDFVAQGKTVQRRLHVYTWGGSSYNTLSDDDIAHLFASLPENSVQGLKLRAGHGWSTNALHHASLRSRLIFCNKSQEIRHSVISESPGLQHLQVSTAVTVTLDKLPALQSLALPSRAPHVLFSSAISHKGLRSLHLCLERIIDTAATNVRHLLKSLGPQLETLGLVTSDYGPIEEVADFRSSLGACQRLHQFDFDLAAMNFAPLAPGLSSQISEIVFHFNLIKEVRSLAQLVTDALQAPNLNRLSKIVICIEPETIHLLPQDTDLVQWLSLDSRVENEMLERGVELEFCQ